MGASRAASGVLVPVPWGAFGRVLVIASSRGLGRPSGRPSSHGHGDWEDHHRLGVAVQPPDLASAVQQSMQCVVANSISSAHLHVRTMAPWGVRVGGLPGSRQLPMHCTRLSMLIIIACLLGDAACLGGFHAAEPRVDDPEVQPGPGNVLEQLACRHSVWRAGACGRGETRARERRKQNKKARRVGRHIGRHKPPVSYKCSGQLGSLGTGSGGRCSMGRGHWPSPIACLPSSIARANLVT